MNKALLVIDVQNYFMNSLTQGLPGEIRRYIEKTKNNYKEIVFTNFVNRPSSSTYRFLNYKECMRSPDTDIVDELKPVLSFGTLLTKHVLSAIKVTKLQKLFEQSNITELYLCGIDTDCCVLASAYDAFDLGYRVYLLKDLCMTATGRNLHDAAVSMFKKNVGLVKTASSI